MRRDKQRFDHAEAYRFAKNFALFSNRNSSFDRGEPLIRYCFRNDCCGCNLVQTPLEEGKCGCLEAIKELLGKTR